MALHVRDLIRAGSHFGHRTSRWNPKMAPYIFKRRNLIHIIDLRQTLRGLLTARRLAGAISARGEHVLFVGTKKQAHEAIEREAKRCGMPYVTERWLGGLLTNYVTIRRRLERLEELEEMERTGEMELHSKKMISMLRRESRKINRNLGGVRNMDRLPGLLIVVDPAREHIAVQEAAKLGIPIVALIDTDGDPDKIDVVVPANDDSIGTIEIFARTCADGVLSGLAERKGRQAPEAEDQAEAEAEAQGMMEDNEVPVAEAADPQAEAPADEPPAEAPDEAVETEPEQPAAQAEDQPAEARAEAETPEAEEDAAEETRDAGEPEPQPAGPQPDADAAAETDAAADTDDPAGAAVDAEVAEKD